MSEVPERFVTVGTFPDVSIAHLARGRLEEAGIACFIAEENTGGLLLGIGMSWPKLQVAEEDALRAIAVLESQFGPEEPEPRESQVEAPEGAITLRERFARFGAGEAREEPLTGATPQAPSDEEEVKPPRIDRSDPEDRSDLAIRAFRAALIGLLLGPLAAFGLLVFALVPIVGYSIYLLVRVWESQEPLTERARWRAWAALTMNAVVIAGAAYFLRLLLSSYD